MSVLFGLFRCPQVAKNQINVASNLSAIFFKFLFFWGHLWLQFFFKCTHLYCTSVWVNGSSLAELSIILIVVRLTLNVDTQNNYCTHRTDPHRTNQTSAALSHAPFPAILDDDLTSQLGWIDSRGLPTECIIVYPFCICLTVCSPSRASFVPILSAWVMRMWNRAHWIHSVVGNSTKVFIQNICLI